MRTRGHQPPVLATAFKRSAAIQECQKWPSDNSSFGVLTLRQPQLDQSAMNQTEAPTKHPMDRPPEKPLTDDSLSGWMLLFAQVLAIATLGFIGADAWPWKTLTWPFVGVGLVLIILAFAGLKSSFTAIPEPNMKGLRTGGIYGLVRHPMYTGLILIGVGICFSSRPLSWVFCGFLASVLLFKSILEDTLLGRAYPEFAEYKRRTKRFLPFLL